MKFTNINPRQFFKTLFLEKPSLAIMASVIAAIFIGFSGIFVRLSDVAPISSGLFRFFFAIPFLWTWMMFDNVKTEQPRMPATLKDYGLLLLAGLFFALDMSIWNISIVKTSVMNATLLNNLTPIFVALFAWLILKERLTPFLVIGILLSIVGSVILIKQSENSSVGSLIGDLLALFSSVFYAGYIIVSKYLRNTFTTATVMAWSTLFTFYFTAIFVLLESGNIFPTTLYGWSILFCFALVVHVIGQGLMSYSLRHLGSIFTSLVLMLGPISATITSWFLFGEVVSFLQLTGAFIVLLGIVLARQTMPVPPEQIKSSLVRNALSKIKLKLMGRKLS